MEKEIYGEWTSRQIDLTNDDAEEEGGWKKRINYRHLTNDYAEMEIAEI